MFRGKMGQIPQDGRKLGSPPVWDSPRHAIISAIWFEARQLQESIAQSRLQMRLEEAAGFLDQQNGWGMPHTSCWAGGRLNSWWIRSVSSWCWMLTNQVFFTFCMLSDYWLKRSRGSPEDSYSHFDSGFARVDCEAKVKPWAGQILKSTPCIPTNCY